MTDIIDNYGLCSSFYLLNYSIISNSNSINFEVHLSCSIEREKDYFERFNSFDDFADIIELFRSTSIESNTNKRWTSKYVFPYGKDCIFEDLDQNARTNDRHFFRRTGELLYLMMSRSSYRSELQAALEHQILTEESKWNKIVSLLQPEKPE